MKYLVANFKMNPSTAEEFRAWLDEYAILRYVRMSKCRVVLCPPFVWLPLMRHIDMSKLRNVELGAQDAFWEMKGAWTGEISPLMLKDLGCQYVIIGHSERRALGETDAVIHKKLAAALKAGLKPILAVGEKMRTTNAKGALEREVGPVLEEQLSAALTGIPKAKIAQLLFAYEPVWAVGTGIAATPEDALKAALYIRKVVMRFTGKTKTRLKVLYGGSVTARNVAPFLREEGLDGALVGGASLNVEEFLEMVASVS